MPSSAQTGDDESTSSPSSDRPPTSPSALDVARRVLVRVEGGAYATLALSGELARARLDDGARGLCTELVYGSLRQRATLDRALSALAPRGLSSLDPQVRVLLRLGAYQLLFTRVPPARAVNQVVSALRSLRGPGLAGFANALLRRLSREGLPASPPIPADAPPAVVADRLAEQHGLPRFLVADILDTRGRDDTEALLAAWTTPAPTWLRLNPLRGSLADARAALAREHVELATDPVLDPDKVPSPSLPEAARLQSGHPFDGPAYAEGWFTAQDLGAQLVAQLLLSPTPDGPLMLPPGPILDACCGTGGKSTHLAALTTGSPRRIDAVDQSARKLDLCRQHVARLRCPQVHPASVDLLDPAAIAAHLQPPYAAILLDAPCSGSGVLRRHPEAKNRLTPAQIRDLASMQRRMVENLLPLLAPGGVFVYAVCSLLSVEGRDLTAALLREHPDLRPLPPDARPPWTATYQRTPFEGLTTWPHLHNADSFYAIRLHRVPRSPR